MKAAGSETLNEKKGALMANAILFEKQENKVKIEIDLANLGILKRTGREGANAVVFTEYQGKRLKVQVLCYEVPGEGQKRI